jgi:hypothetical protein
MSTAAVAIFLMLATNHVLKHKVACNDICNFVAVLKQHTQKRLFGRLDGRPFHHVMWCAANMDLGNARIFLHPP